MCKRRKRERCELCGVEVANSPKDWESQYVGLCKEQLVHCSDGRFAWAAEKQELLLPSLLVAEQQQQPRETEGDRGMDVDAAVAEGEEDREEAEKGALAGKHKL